MTMMSFKQLNKECLSALCLPSVTHGFCSVWKSQMLIGWADVCLEALHSDCFCCMWYLLSRNPVFWLLLLYVVFVMFGNHAFSLDEYPSSPAGGSFFVVPALWLVEWFTVVWRRRPQYLKCFCNIRNKFVTEFFEGIYLKKEYQSRLNFCGESKSRLEIKEFLVDMLFLGGGGLKKVYIHTHARQTR